MPAGKLDGDGMFGNADGDIYETSVSGSKLIEKYEQFADRYFSNYPEVKNPAALLEGITEFISFIMKGAPIPDHTFIYVRDENSEPGDFDVNDCTYFFLLSKRSDENGSPTGYSLHFIYAPELVSESLSVFEEDNVVWSPDTLDNSEHITRTKYYMGFVYKLCEYSPGFDEEPEPESEISVEELLTYVKGNLPPDMIEVKLPDTEEVDAEEEEQAASWQAESDEETESDWGEELFEDAEAEPAFAVPEHDDTEITMVTPEQYEEEYDDLQTDYEELFE